MSANELEKAKSAYINKAMKMFAKQGRDEGESIKLAQAMWKKIGKKRAEGKLGAKAIKGKKKLRQADPRAGKGYAAIEKEEREYAKRVAQRRLKKKM